MMVEIALVSVAALGLYQGIRWVQAKGTQHDNGFRRSVLSDAAEMVAPRINRPVQEVMRSLQDSVDTSLRGVVARVECVITKQSASECECKVVAAIIEGENAVLLSSTRNVAWEDLASQIRHDFIRLGGGPQTYVMYEPPQPSSLTSKSN